MDVKEWLKNGTELEVEENNFVTPPPLPYILYILSIQKRGSDEKNNITEYNLDIELYSDEVDIDNEEKIETLIETLNVEYSKNREYISSEKMNMTLYNLNCIEKEKK